MSVKKNYDTSIKPEIFSPVNKLSSFIKYYWTSEGTQKETPQKKSIVPDETQKLIFHYKDSYRHYPKNGQPVM